MHRMNLQLFAEAAGAENSGAGTGAATGTGTENTGTTDGQTAGKTTYSQEDLDRIATERASRASQSAMKDYLKQQGLDDAGIAEAIKDYKSKKAVADEAAKGDLAKQTQRAEAAEKARAAAIDSANKRVVSAEAKVIAVGLGVKSDRTDYAVRLADLSKVTVSDDGMVDTAAVKAAIEAVLKDLPELKGAGTADPPSGFKAGSSGGSGGSATEDQIAAAFGLKKK